MNQWYYTAIRFRLFPFCYPTYELCIRSNMVDAHLRSETIETADIKNLIIGEQTGFDLSGPVLLLSLMGRILPILLSAGSCNTRARIVRMIL